MSIRGIAVGRERLEMASGSQLGSRYFLGEPIGRGAMGVVYDATSVDGETLAIKLLRPELASDDKTVARFVQERQIFRLIDHPNVVRVHDLVAEGDQLGIAMDKVEGGDLRQRVEAGTLSPSVAMKIAAGVAAGLDAIHAADVVHRDLKPANILLTESADGLQPKISDFGISRLVSEAMTRTSTTIGTPLYMAPEAADKRGAKAPADIYSLGAMMFELLISAAPFTQGGTMAVLLAHASTAPPFISGVPPALAELIDQMLAKVPEDRPSAATVRDRLLTILPTIDDSQRPIAVERSVSESTAPAFVIPTPGIAATGGDLPSDSAETKMFDPQSTIAEPHISLEPSDSAETIFDPTVVAAAPPAVSNPPMAVSNSPAGVSNPPTDPEPVPAPILGTTPGPTSGSGPTPGPGPAPGPTSGPSGGLASTLLDERPKRFTGLFLAVASVVAAAGIVGYLALRGGGADSETADGGVDAVESIDDESGSAGDGGSTNVEPGSNDSGGSGPGLFEGATGDSDGGGTGDGGSGDGATATTVNNPAPPTTSKSTTTAGATSSTDATSTTASTSTSTSTTTPSTSSTTSTTEQTTTTAKPTTTTSTTSTTTTTTAPTTTPIAIEGGVSVLEVGPTMFRFNYFTNDVCGTGSFSVVEKSSGTTVGSYTGDNICYGPRHGGWPGHSSFPGFSLTPGTTYNVFISVRGTASDGVKKAGSGTANTSFQVTTSS